MRKAILAMIIAMAFAVVPKKSHAAPPGWSFTCNWATVDNVKVSHGLVYWQMYCWYESPDASSAMQFGWADFSMPISWFIPAFSAEDGQVGPAPLQG